MTIKQKAKAYDEALETAKMYYKQNKDFNVGFLSIIFPELKESEDEKIRKALIRFHKSTIDIDGIKGSDIVAWLEKQGEQKPKGKSVLEAINEEKVDNANKVEPKQDEFTKFEKAVKQVMEEAIECGDTRNLKADADMLLSLVHKSAWKPSDKQMNTSRQVISGCSYDIEPLVEMEEQLKKLREE